MTGRDSESRPNFDLEALKARVGRVIHGKWTLDKLLGVGGMAAVYAATHEIGRREAIKILHPEVAGDADVLARFKREAKVANRFAHPGAVAVRDVDVTEDGEPFLVMDLLEGQSLARRIKRGGKLEADEALRIADEVLDVLAAAHAEGVVHRDIKPSNLFIEPSDRVKVLDFGVARLTHGKTTLITDAGTTLGTVAYMPPEQLRSSVVDHRADLYALGATLFRALSGEHPHEVDDEAELARQILSTPVRPLSAALDGADAELTKVLDRALAVLPERRYPDARTMQSDVRALREGRPPPFAAARLAEGDDPRSREPLDEVEIPASSHRPDVAEEADTDLMPTAPAEDPVEDAVEEGGGTERIEAEDGTTRKMATSEPPRPVGPTQIDEVVEEARAVEAEKPRKSSLLFFLLLAAAIGVGLYAITQRAEGPETSYEPPRPSDLPAGVGGVDALAPEAGGAPAHHGPDEVLGPEPPVPTALPGARPTATGLPTSRPTSWPTALPTTLPTSWPTAIPTSWPTAIPTSWPTAFPTGQPKAPPPSPPPPPAVPAP